MGRDAHIEAVVRTLELVFTAKRRMLRRWWRWQARRAVGEAERREYNRLMGEQAIDRAEERRALERGRRAAFPSGPGFERYRGTSGSPHARRQQGDDSIG